MDRTETPSQSLAALLGALAARGVLGAAYWAIVTPIALALRAAGRTPLDLGFRDGRASYWITKEPKVDNLERYGKPY